MITNNQKFRMMKPLNFIDDQLNCIRFSAPLLTFINKGDDGMWWCKTEDGREIGINPLDYVIVKED